MQPHHTKAVERYFFFALLFLTLVFVAILFKPFFGVLVVGASLAVVLFPMHNWLTNKKLPTWLSALLVVIFFIIIFVGPIFGIGVMVFNESQEMVINLTRNGGVETFGFIEKLEAGLIKILPEGINLDLNQKIFEIVSVVTNNLAKIFTTTLTTIFYFILTLLSLFYFLKDGNRWKKFLVMLSPLSDEDDKKIIGRLSQAVNGIVTGYLLIALLQGTFMGIGLAIFGVPNPVLWGVVAGLGSFIPTIGTSIVSIPAFIFLMATGQTGNAIGYATWAVMLVGSIDNFLNPIFIGSRINIPPLLILFAVLGGIAMMGPLGILIGPLSVSLLYTLILIYRNEFQEKKS